MSKAIRNTRGAVVTSMTEGEKETAGRDDGNSCMLCDTFCRTKGEQIGVWCTTFHNSPYQNGNLFIFTTN